MSQRLLLTGGGVAIASINGSSGQVWFHSWHANFIQSRELSG